MKTLYKFAKLCTMTVAFVRAAYYFSLGALVFCLTLWFAWPVNFDGGTAAVLCTVIAIGGISVMAKAAEILSSARPQNQNSSGRPFAFESTRDRKRRGDDRNNPR